MNIKVLLIFTMAFIGCTVLGTISHEYGHILVARTLGYQTTLHYGSISYDKDKLNSRVKLIYRLNKTAIDNHIDYKDKVAYERGIEKINFDRFLVTLGGPLQTIAAGSVGLLMLLWRRKKINLNGLERSDWLAVFLSLFWLREVFNLVMSVGKELIVPDGFYFGGDEKKISDFLNLWPGTFSLILGFIGLVVALFIVFKIVPCRLRLTFIVSGFIGGILGFVLWMQIIGPVLLP